jgi:hypothetical protein
LLINVKSLEVMLELKEEMLNLCASGRRRDRDQPTLRASCSNTRADASLEITFNWFSF